MESCHSLTRLLTHSRLKVSLVVVEVVVMNILATLTKLSCGHAIEFGRCSSVSGDPYFHPDELEGLWYVIEMYKTSSRCMTITFQRTLDGFTGTEVRELLVGRRVGLDHSVSNTGVFTFKNIDNPALMKVRWPSVFIDKPADVTVVDTDGVHFAVLYECQSLWVLRRASAVILSRQPFLDEAVLQRVKEDLAKLNINTEHLTTIQHDDCQALHEADLNINLNTVVRIMKQGWQSRGRGLVTHVTILDTVRALAAPTTPPTPTVPVRPARPAKPARPTKPTTRH
ncbi:apolipoprotein D-like isoform X2 [Portunus trituberculatus]|uniref:apolipoprotein D-like isoform X2 n=1 Tax=Portunus trituberculatus TaxID=210409 RepID=UPI001E1CBBA3|nr:apolipoprotein D-like isoform X2 [Portunus trituberculatus]